MLLRETLAAIKEWEEKEKEKKEKEKKEKEREKNNIIKTNIYVSKKMAKLKEQEAEVEKKLFIDAMRPKRQREVEEATETDAEEDAALEVDERVEEEEQGKAGSSNNG